MSEPKKREWTVPEDLRELLAQGVYVPVDREAVKDAEIEVEIIKHRLGGVVKSAPIRVKANDQWIVVGHSYQWESFAPGMTIDLDQQADGEPADDPEPVLN